MNTKKITLIGFVITIIAQLYVPIKMILDQENTLHLGNAFKFETKPVDPYDQFRGKYISLSFKQDRVAFELDKFPKEKWFTGKEVYAYLETDKKGFAKISALREKPDEKLNSDFVKVIVRRYTESNDSKNTVYVTIKYPFDRYYMEESKAYPAEKLYRKMNTETYALVYIRNGKATLKDVFINQKSIKKLIKEQQQNKDSSSSF